jgi:hypothetical protein
MLEEKADRPLTARKLRQRHPRRHHRDARRAQRETSGLTCAPNRPK